MKPTWAQASAVSGFMGCPFALETRWPIFPLTSHSLFTFVLCYTPSWETGRAGWQFITLLRGLVRPAGADCCTTTSSFREDVRMGLPQALKCDAQSLAQSISSAVAFLPAGAHAKRECTHTYGQTSPHSRLTQDVSLRYTQSCSSVNMDPDNLNIRD